MYAEPLPCSIRAPSLVLISRAVFLSADTHIDRDKVKDGPDHPTHGSATIVVGVGTEWVTVTSTPTRNPKVIWEESRRPPPHARLLASSLDPADPPPQTASRPNQPFPQSIHWTDTKTHRQTDRQTHTHTHTHTHRYMVHVTRPVPIAAYALWIEATWLMMVGLVPTDIWIGIHVSMMSHDTSSWATVKLPVPTKSNVLRYRCCLRKQI